MASIHKEMLIAAPVERVWAAVRNIGEIHTQFAREFVVDTRVEGTSRLVTFANGMVVREQIVLGGHPKPAINGQLKTGHFE